MDFTKEHSEKTLYKRGVRGEVRVWRMDLGGDGTNSTFGHRVVSGIIDGKETESGWTTCVAKNVGKKNETSSYAQAVAEISAEYTKKLDRGYFEDISAVDTFQKVKPMLAVDWQKRKKHVSIADGAFAQPKLDGIRCIARATGLWTRSGKEITSCAHIVDALSSFFVAHPNLIIDGELYNHDLREDFNTITSIVRKAKTSDEEREKAEALIQYHIYDIVDPDMSFCGRNDLIKQLFAYIPQDCIQLVETKHVNAVSELDDLYGSWMESGYEGQMIRLNVPYENKRSNSLIKRKEFVTEEFKVTGIHEGEGNWSGAVKRFSLIMDNGSEFGAGVRGTYDDMAALLSSGNVPSWATIRYFSLTPDGIPRFPVVIDYGFDAERSD